MAVVSRLDLPSRKMLVEDLRRAVKVTVTDTLSSTSIKLWNIPLGDNMMSFSIVWIQGRVKEVGSEEFLLDDSTGTARIISTNVPAACPKPTMGKYMMVIGQLDAVSDPPTVLANKLQDLSDNAALQTLWPLEVQDIYRQCRT